jgi:serine/threonine-protein kinase
MAIGDPRLTAVNTIGGTPAYMSPEQADPSRGVDWRSDIYSLGAVAYFLTTGRPPFTQSTPSGLILAHIQAPVDPPSQHGDVPQDLELCILRCLEKLPENRFASARQLEAELARCAAADSWTSDDAAQWWRDHDEAAIAR